MFIPTRLFCLLSCFLFGSSLAAQLRPEPFTEWLIRQDVGYFEVTPLKTWTSTPLEAVRISAYPGDADAARPLGGARPSTSPERSLETGIGPTLEAPRRSWVTLKAILAPGMTSGISETAPSDWTYIPLHWGLFCRLEEQIDRAVGTAVRFRLGSVDYVDKLEGKRR